jgi:hypothetical protein
VTAAIRPARPPFAFAKRHGVLVDMAANGSALVLFTAETPPVILQELQRVLPGEVQFERYSGTDFDRRLQGAYEQDASRSEEMMADLNGALDLTALARELNEPADLLESADDAPIIRLINALLGEATHNLLYQLVTNLFTKLVARLGPLYYNAERDPQRAALEEPARAPERVGRRALGGCRNRRRLRERREHVRDLEFVEPPRGRTRRSVGIKQ